MKDKKLDKPIGFLKVDVTLTEEQKRKFREEWLRSGNIIKTVQKKINKHGKY